MNILPLVHVVAFLFVQPSTFTKFNVNTFRLRTEPTEYQNNERVSVSSSFLEQIKSSKKYRIPASLPSRSTWSDGKHGDVAEKNLDDVSFLDVVKKERPCENLDDVDCLKDFRKKLSKRLKSGSNATRRRPKIKTKRPPKRPPTPHATHTRPKLTTKGQRRPHSKQRTAPTTHIGQQHMQKRPLDGATVPLWLSETPDSTFEIPTIALKKPKKEPERVFNTRPRITIRLLKVKYRHGHRQHSHPREHRNMHAKQSKQQTKLRDMSFNKSGGKHAESAKNRRNLEKDAVARMTKPMSTIFHGCTRIFNTVKTKIDQEYKKIRSAGVELREKDWANVRQFHQDALDIIYGTQDTMISVRRPYRILYTVYNTTQNHLNHIYTQKTNELEMMT